MILRVLLTFGCVVFWFTSVCCHVVMPNSWKLLVQIATFIRVSVNKIVLFSKYSFIVITIVIPRTLSVLDPALVEY